MHSLGLSGTIPFKSDCGASSARKCLPKGYDPVHPPMYEGDEPVRKVLIANRGEIAVRIAGLP